MNIKNKNTYISNYLYALKVVVIAAWVLSCTYLNVSVYNSHNPYFLIITIFLSISVAIMLPKAISWLTRGCFSGKSLYVWPLFPAVFAAMVVLKIVLSLPAIGLFSFAELTADLGDYTLELAIVCLLSIFYVISSLVIGEVLLSLFKFKFSGGSLQKCVLSFCTGQAIMIFVMIMLGFAGFYYKPLIYLLLLVPSAVFHKKTHILVKTFLSWKINFLSQNSDKSNLALVSWSAALLAVLVFVLMIINSFTIHPYVTDTLRVYTSLPTMYVEQHGIVHYEASVNGYYPQNAEMIFALGILLFDQNVINFFILINLLAVTLLLLLIYRHFLKTSSVTSPPIFISAFLMVPAIMYFGYGNAKVDIIMLLYVLAAVYTAVLAARNNGLKYVTLFGLFAGVALGVKYTAIISIAAIFVAIPILLVDDWKKVFKIWFVSGGIAVIIISPWLARNYSLSGNPVAPFFLNTIYSEASFFNQVGEDSYKYISKASRDTSYYQLFNKEDKGLSYYLSLPFHVLSNNSGLVMRMNDMGPLFLSLIFLLFSRGIFESKVSKFILGVVILHASAYLFVIENKVVWYVLPMFALLLVLYQTSLDSLRMDKMKAVSYLVLFVSLVSFFVHGKVHEFTKIKSTVPKSSLALGDYSQTRFDELRALSQMLNSREYKEGKIYFANDSAVYYLDDFHKRVIPSKYIELWGYYHDKGLNSNEIIEEFKRLEVKYIIVNKGQVDTNVRLLDYASKHSPNITTHYLGWYESFDEFLIGTTNIYEGLIYSVYSI